MKNPRSERGSTRTPATQALTCERCPQHLQKAVPDAACEVFYLSFVTGVRELARPGLSCCYRGGLGLQLGGLQLGPLLNTSRRAASEAPTSSQLPCSF
jgi:hypothetical protein